MEHPSAARTPCVLVPIGNARKQTTTKIIFFLTAFNRIDTKLTDKSSNDKCASGLSDGGAAPRLDLSAFALIVNVFVNTHFSSFFTFPKHKKKKKIKSKIFCLRFMFMYYAFPLCVAVTASVFIQSPNRKLKMKKIVSSHYYNVCVLTHNK